MRGSVALLICLFHVSALVAVAEDPDRWLESDLFIVNADGTGLLNLTDDRPAQGCPSWSPDGSRIAFEQKDDAQWDICSIAPDGSGFERLTNHPGHDCSPAWSPDGEYIAFASTRDGDLKIFVMKVDGTETRCVTSSLPSGTYHDQPAWSPDGNRIAFMVIYDSRTAQDLFRVNADGSGLVEFTPESLADEVAYNESPVWMPDGERIVFNTGVSTIDRYVLMSALPDGSDLQEFPMTAPPGSRYWEKRAVLNPSWDASGKSLVYALGVGLNPTRCAIYRVPEPGQAPVKVADDQTVPDATLLLESCSSPDGKQVAFVRCNKLPLRAGVSARTTKLDAALLMRRDNIGKVFLGANGEFIVPPAGAVPAMGYCLFILREKNGGLRLLAGFPDHEKPYATVRPDGSIMLTGKVPEGNNTLASPSLWPYRDGAGVLAVPPRGSVLAKDSGSKGSKLQEPKDCIGWLYLLAELHLRAPSEQFAPFPNILWVVRREDQLVLLHSGPLFKGTYAIVESDGEMRVMQRDAAGSETIERTQYWPYVDGDGNLAMIPAGSGLPRDSQPASAIIVHPGGGFMVKREPAK